LRFVLTDPIFVRLLTALYILAGLGLVLTDYNLNDEGLLTHYWASWARREPAAIFFFQRLRPVLSAFYAPVSGIGVHWTLGAHVVVAALSIPLIAATARALRYRYPNLPALIVAFSPLYFYGGPAGISNADGVVGICLTLYLLCGRGQPLLAGVLAGMIPWMRFELGLFSAVLAVHGILVQRDRQLLAGMSIFPLLYLASGAAYHLDALWFIHYPPTSPADPSDPMWQGQLRGLRYFLEAWLALTPLAAVIAVVPLARLQTVERTLLAYLLITALVMNIFPIFQIGNFGTAPRYSMGLLPVLALLVSRVFEAWSEGKRPNLATLLTMSMLALWLATRQESLATVVVLLTLQALLVYTAWRQVADATAVVAIVLIISGPFLAVRTDVTRTETAVFLDPMMRWLQAHRREIDKPILTNVPILAAFLETRVPGLDVHFMAGVDMTRDAALINPHNGQQEAIGRVAPDLYGRGIFRAVTPADFPSGALFLLANDRRLSLLLPDEIWAARLEVIEQAPHYRIARLAATP